jgi:segregation and condensation protein B
MNPEIVQMAEIQNKPDTSLKHILEALLLSAGEPLNLNQIAAVFSEEERPTPGQISKALEELSTDCLDRGIELKEVASGFRLQIRQRLNTWVQRLWEERPQRYSRALLETLALIAYRQPITRGDIEEVRGVSVRSSIIRTLQEREWIRVVGHRDVPGKPALFGTTRAFLDYFDLKSLDDLPTLAEIRDMESIEPELDLEPVVTENEEPAGIENEASS